EPAAQLPRAAIGVDGKQDECPRLRCVRMIDTGGSADEPMTRLCDHERSALANDLLRLAEDRLDLARVAFVACELTRLGGRLQVVDAHDAPLDLRDHLL